VVTRKHDVRTPEQEAALRSIIKLMEFWGIAPNELASDIPELPDNPLPVVQAVAMPPSIKYRHPVSGDTWDGEGAQPDWLRAALTKEGYTVEELKRLAMQAEAAS
jgi:DNA-binding protein H-NS